MAGAGIDAISSLLQLALGKHTLRHAALTLLMTPGLVLNITKASAYAVLFLSCACLSNLVFLGNLA